MSDSERSMVLRFAGDDEEMQRACDNARATFRYFWRELSWECRRIAAALDLACIKARFTDPEPDSGDDDDSAIEHMWVSDVSFNGRLVSGVLLNSANGLKSVREGDAVQFPLSELSDWMYVSTDQVCGGHTVQLMRSRMSSRERKEHDAAWDLEFGDPRSVRLVPDWYTGAGLVSKLFGRRPSEPGEHPMSEPMAASLKEQLAQDPSLATADEGRGWTLLHHEALAGNVATVKVLLEAGADRHAVTSHGQTPLQLAQSLGWDAVAELLRSFRAPSIRDRGFA